MNNNDNNIISIGSQVIVYSSRDQIDSIIIKLGEQFQSRFGHFKHETMINLKFGSKCTSSNGRGFVYLLKPTPELWTQALPHRTQILYLPDISFISNYLNIKSGTKVIEAGTGSGSFSHSLARSVGTKGKVYSYEYHEARFLQAEKEFKSHGLDSVITIKHQNVCKDGFERVDEIDSVFLDVPAPWDAIEHAKIALRKDVLSRICCFSPCIEQVLKTVSALSEHGFSDITMYETLTRTHDPAPYFNPSISTAIDRIQAVEEKKGRRRDAQIQDAKSRKVTRDLKRKADEALDAEGEVEGNDVEEPLRKKIALEEGRGDDVEMDLTTLPILDLLSVPPRMPKMILVPNSNPSSTPPIKQFTFKASAQSRGHTSYLTFATLLPITITSTSPTSISSTKIAATSSKVEVIPVEIEGEEA